MLRRELCSAPAIADSAWPEDYDLVLRLLENGEKLGMVPERLLHWRDGPGRLSRSSPRYAQSAFVECKAEFFPGARLLAERPSSTCFGATA